MSRCCGSAPELIRLNLAEINASLAEFVRPAPGGIDVTERGEELNESIGTSGLPEDQQRRVAMLIYPGVAPLDVAGPLQVFEICNIIRGRRCYDVVTVAPTAEPVPTSVGITFLPSLAMADLELPIDTVLVSGGGSPQNGMTPPIAQWLRRAARQARRYGSVCTGAFALGAAGLIDGKRVTTHWLFAEELAARHPLARVDADPIFIRDGNLYTSGGITAGIDLGLALLEEDYGREFALEVARHLVLFLKRSGDQRQFSTHLQAQFSDVPAIQKVQAWCLERLGEDLRVASMARHAAMSERNFVRIFRKETGQTPGQFVAAARLQAACRMLEETDRSLEDVAARCKLGGSAGMRRAFRKQLRMSPAQYRAKFGPVASTRAYAHSGTAAPFLHP